MMNAYSAHFTQRRGLLIHSAAVIASLTVGCGSFAQAKVARKPPFDLPFPVHKAGARIETDVRIVEDRSYRFILMFMFKTPEERKRVSDLVGGAYTALDPRGNLERPGITVPIRLTVHELRNNEPNGVLLDKRYDSQGHEAFSANAFNRFIDSIALAPGQYRLTAETLQNVPELEGVESKFYFYSRYL